MKDQIYNLLINDYSLRYDDIAQQLGCSRDMVEKVAKTLPENIRAERYSKINHYAKLKSNPMRGKIKEKHHNSKEIVIISGYLSMWAPEWWTGHMPKGNRAFVHQVNWAQANGATAVPKGYVIHHKDENKFNNDPLNLVCITRKEHAQIHCVSNLLARRNDYPQGVGDSVLEAQSILLG